MSRKARFVAAVLMIVLGTLMLAGAVSAAMPEAFFPLGTSRYAAVTAGAYTSTASGVFVDLPALTTTIAIPAGKVGDVMVYFCGETRTKTLAYARAVITGVGILSPITMQIREMTTEGNYESQCANYVRAKVPGSAVGPLTVKMQWRTTPGGGFVEMVNRSMIVVVNIH